VEGCAALDSGGHATYSDDAIQTCLMLRAAFNLPLRQAEGLLTSFIELLGEPG
jgi:Transposase DDE domain